jgi:putative endonuclease
MLAALLLVLKGHRILGRRIKTRAGEIDLVTAAPFGPVCFIEVKARGNTRAAAEAVMGAQRARIARAASLYLAGRPKLARRGARFDIVAVAPGGWPRHFRDVWRNEDLP